MRDKDEYALSLLRDDTYIMPGHGTSPMMKKDRSPFIRGSFMEILPNDDDSKGYSEIIKHRFILSFESFHESWIPQILEALDPAV